MYELHAIHDQGAICWKTQENVLVVDGKHENNGMILNQWPGIYPRPHILKMQFNLLV